MVFATSFVTQGSSADYPIIGGGNSHIGVYYGTAVSAVSNVGSEGFAVPIYVNKDISIDGITFKTAGSWASAEIGVYRIDVSAMQLGQQVVKVTGVNVGGNVNAVASFAPVAITKGWYWIAKTDLSGTTKSYNFSGTISFDPTAPVMGIPDGLDGPGLSTAENPVKGYGIAVTMGLAQGTPIVAAPIPAIIPIVGLRVSTGAL